MKDAERADPDHCAICGRSVEVIDGKLRHKRRNSPTHMPVTLGETIRPDYRRQLPAAGGVDKNDIPIPWGWSVYFDGELVFSVGDEKWREIGPGIEKIMEG